MNKEEIIKTIEKNNKSIEIICENIFTCGWNSHVKKKENNSIETKEWETEGNEHKKSIILKTEALGDIIISLLKEIEVIEKNNKILKYEGSVKNDKTI